MNSDQWARAILRGQWTRFKGAAPSLTMLQGVQAIARLETHYGGPGDPAWAGSNNWGAIQCPKGSGNPDAGVPCGEGCFSHTDRHADGTTYTGCYKKYDSPEAGAFDLIRTLLAKGLRSALASGNSPLLSDAMRRAGYFELGAEHYAGLISANARDIARSLSEPNRWAAPAPGSDAVELALLGGLGYWLYRAWRKGKRHA